MIAIDLSAPDATADAPMREITGRRETVGTRCRLTRRGGRLAVRVDARDPHVLDLLATAPRDGVCDPFLYEEDTVQVALARPGEAAPADFMLINAMGSRRAIGGASAWRAACSRSAEGWSAEVEIELPPAAPAVGLSVHRFYRGVHHEVHGLTPIVPHPLDPAAFAVLALGAGNLDATARRFVDSVRASQTAQRERTLAGVRARLAARRPLPTAWADRAASLALRRAKREVVPATQFLCWNEGHYLHALIDLWELRRDPAWLELAAGRIDRVWEFTGERLGVHARVWDRPLPTWYDHADELGTAITLITGVILWPMARLIAAARRGPAPVALRERAERWLGPIRRAIAVHDCEWIDLPRGRGWYLEPYVKGPRRVYPDGGSRPAPLNRALFLALPMLELDDPADRPRIEAMARYFRDAQEVAPDGAVIWEYLAGRYPATGEDLSHASCQVAFAERCQERGIEFTLADLRGIAQTLRARVFRFGDVPCGELRGLSPALDPAVGAWSGLCRFAPELLPHIAAVVETFHSESPAFFEAEGWGIRLLTNVARAMAEQTPRPDATIRA